MTQTLPKPAQSVEPADVRAAGGCTGDEFIAYAVQRFPALRTTFIRREIEALRSLGVPIRVVSMRRHDPREIEGDPGAAAHATSTEYLPENPLSFGSVAANLVGLLRHPLLTVKNLRLALDETGEGGFRPRVRLALQCWRGAVLARRLSRMGTPVHIHAHFADGAATTALVAARLLGVPFSFTSHTSHRPAALHAKIREATFIASISEVDRRQLLDAESGSKDSAKIQIVHCGLPIVDWPYAPRRLPRSQIPVILSVGALIEKKGHDVLIKACGMLRDSGIAFQCRIVGGGPLHEELESLIRSLNLTDHVKLLGPQAQQVVRQELQACDLFALACRRAHNGDTDGLPVSLIEAMAIGRPVVSCQIAGIGDLIEHGRSGFLIEPGDVQAMASALRYALRDCDELHEIVDAARVHVERQFDARREAEKLAQLFSNARAHSARDAHAGSIQTGESPRLLINAVSARIGGGLKDLVNTVPLLVDALREQGWSIDLCVSEEGARALASAGISGDFVRQIDVAGPLKRAVWEFIRLPRLVARRRPSTVFQFSNLIFRRLPVPQITVLRSLTFYSADYGAQRRRGIYQALRYRIGRYYSRWTITGASSVFCISESQRCQIIRTVGKIGQRVEVAHLGLSAIAHAKSLRGMPRQQLIAMLTPRLREKLQPFIGGGRRVLVNIANYYSQKNLLTLLEAVDRLSGRDSKLTLVLTAGITSYDGPRTPQTDREMALARRLETSGVLCDLGPVCAASVPVLLAAADLFIFPSSVEAFGHPLLEAMSMGVPVIAADTDIHREICADAAVYHDVFRPESLASSIESLLESPVRCDELIRRGFENARRFSWKSHVDKLTAAIIRTAVDCRSSDSGSTETHH